MSRNLYLLAYDIKKSARWRAVHKIAKGRGDKLQLSIYHCELSPSELAEMESSLSEVIHHGEDEIMIINLGPAEGSAQERIIRLGKIVLPPDRGPTIV